MAQKKVAALGELEETLLEAPADKVLELDELWSFVHRKSDKVWVWLALCRQTRQVVAFVMGDRSRATCERLWRAIPHDYKEARCYSDFWEAYQQVIEAFRLTKESEAERAARKQAIDRAMRAATETPLDTMRACQQALRGAVVVAANGSRKTTSDVGVAIELLLAGLRGARMNVEINLSTLDDAPYIARVKTEALELERDAAVDADTARGALR